MSGMLYFILKVQTGTKNVICNMSITCDFNNWTTLRFVVSHVIILGTCLLDVQ
jgi:hypothetical protein